MDTAASKTAGARCAPPVLRCGHGPGAIIIKISDKPPTEGYFGKKKKKRTCPALLKNVKVINSRTVCAAVIVNAA